jgi:hypothetical protein
MATRRLRIRWLVAVSSVSCLMSTLLVRGRRARTGRAGDPRGK